MGKEDLMKLQLKQEGDGYLIFLDDKKIHHVEKYEIEQGILHGTALIELRLLVKFP